MEKEVVMMIFYSVLLMHVIWFVILCLGIRVTKVLPLSLVFLALIIGVFVEGL